MQWVFERWLELFGAASCLLYIYLEIRQRVSMWIVGLLSSAVYVIVFFQSSLYAFSGLYVYYIAVSVYGLYCWRYAQKAQEGESRVKRLNLSLTAVLLLISAVLFAGIWYALNTFIDPDVLDIPPYCEALAVSLSIVATWMLAHKILEQWFVWIFVNFFSAFLYFWCELYPTSGLFIIYGIMSIVGWLKWRQSYNKFLIQI